MPIKSKKIFENNKIQDYIEHRKLKIDAFYNLYNEKKFSLPKWQRDDSWNDNWRKILIESILTKGDIPKFYIAKIGLSDTQFLIDGGHRTRSIAKYIQNDFCIRIDEEDVYYNIENENSRKMTEYEKNIFDNYELLITIYKNISEKDARDIFNKLQNAQPMTIADVVNSHESFLVDFLRDMMTTVIVDKELYKYFDKNLKPMPLSKEKSRNSEILYTLASLYTIYKPKPYLPIYLTDEERARSFLLKGKTIDSPCLAYIRYYTDKLSLSDQSGFKEFMKEVIGLIYYLHKEVKIFLSEAEFNSVLHAIKWIDDFSLSEFIKFKSIIDIYILHNKTSEILRKNKQYEESSNELLLSDEINNKHTGNLEIWEKSKRNGGSSISGMKTRLNIIKIYCINKDTVRNIEFKLEENYKDFLGGEEIVTFS